MFSRNKSIVYKVLSTKSEHSNLRQPRSLVPKSRLPPTSMADFNDLLSEAEQMVQAVRAQGQTCAYLMAKDEGHGFAKKPNADFQFLSTIQFLQEHLLGRESVR